MLAAIVAAICIYAVTDVNAKLPDTTIKLYGIQQGAPRRMVGLVRSELYKRGPLIGTNYPVLVGLKFEKSNIMGTKYNVEYTARASNCSAAERPSIEQVNSDMCSGEGAFEHVYCSGRYEEPLKLPLQTKTRRLTAICTVAP